MDKLYIYIYINEQMNKGDQQLVDRFNKNNLTYEEHLDKIIESDYLDNKYWQTLLAIKDKYKRYDQFFADIISITDSIYLLNNDLRSSKDRSNAVIFCLFINQNRKVFKDQDNLMLTFKTSFNDQPFLKFERIDILRKINPKNFQSFVNIYENYNLQFEIKTNNKKEENIGNSWILKTLLKEVYNRSNLSLMRSFDRRNKGTVRIANTFDFLSKYISVEWKKFNKNEKQLERDIFPHVLLLKDPKNTVVEYNDDNAKHKFIFRIVNKKISSDFVDIVSSKEKEFYFYDEEDVDKNDKITNINFNPYDYSQKLENLVKNIEDKNKNLKENYEYFKEKQKENKEEIDSCENNLNKLENNLNKLKEEKELLSSEVQYLKKEIYTKNNNIDELKKQVKDNWNRVKKLKKQKDAQLVIVQKTNEIDRLEKEIKRIQENKNNYDKSLKENDKKISEINKQIKTLEEKKSKLNNESKNLENQINANKTEIQKNDELIKKANKNIELTNEQEIKFYTFNLKTKDISKVRLDDFYHLDISQPESLLDGFVFLTDPSELKNNSYSLFILCNKNYGTFEKNRRLYLALKNLINGVFKNPLLPKSIEAPDSFFITKEELDQLKINTGPINLNEKQVDAVKKAILAPCISYLQGPPGTGKTQSISALIYHIIKNDQKNVLLMSSTNEAILNVFDRIKDLTADDPNFIMYKTIRKNKTDDLNDPNIFDLKHSFNNFMSAIIKYNLNIKDEKNKFLDDLPTLKNLSFNENINVWRQIIDLVDIIFGLKDELLKTNNDEELKIINKYQNKLIKPDQFEKLIKHFQIDGENDIDYNRIIDDYNNFYDHWNKEKINNAKRYLNYLNDFKKTNIWTQYQKLLDLKLNVKDLYKINDYNNNQPIRDKLYLIEGDLSKNTGNEYNEQISKYFSKYIYDNELVNLIGLTTTAKQTISSPTDEKEKSLFLEYPIYMSIVDEVSKSTTAEIINCCMMSEKTLLAGDYKQLPPVTDFENGSINEDQIENESIHNLQKSFPVPWNIWNRLIKEEQEKLEKNKNYKITKTEDGFKDLINELKYPFFKFNVLKLKSNNSNNSGMNFYSFLNEQHRFNEDIQSVVNIVYDDDEKLKTESKQVSKYVMNYLRPSYSYKESFIFVDTSYLSKSFINFLKNKNRLPTGLYNQLKENDFRAFDQNIPLIDNENKDSGARFNEYNGYIINEIIKNLINNNIENDVFDFDQIGVISMTRPQNKVIKYFLNDIYHNKEYKSRIKNHVRVDTVDNFQGREKQIIIVDLVRAQGEYKKENQLIYHNKRNYSFYKSTERINVAVSRAKDLLIIVGAFNDLKDLQFRLSKWNSDQNKIDDSETIAIINEYRKKAREKDTYINIKELDDPKKGGN
ncbi:AAA domain-containing protein [Ureaplasma sp. ES3154-GEN]|uniref:AAA domain-containing protein n=1 Tax=Ureaplasma sp. ES3154-GEN TaxID=2984844 RepID=UPI0021E98E64|nr:AAA domain-containing protein [Ureaplasma sp. ES3154-GEN]MCV3743547.1 AAA domain-containing protein [Ureaplasma sp. ES3154-GEN]